MKPDLKKTNGLIPTIVQDENGQVLMLAYSSRESLNKTLKTKKAVYFSRSRNKLWTKGETSGNFQQILEVKTDCDKDALLFTVKQKCVACHTGSYSCFGNREFSFELLYDTIADRLRNPRPGSYTAMIAEKEKTLRYKILEEADEVINYRDRKNLVWEIADLTYLLTVLMAKKGIIWKEIMAELARRRK
jgi:phosphoribosyl-ATP pyrophosphohydrolase/phosphoribosyl-AMP cyclohydrolase